MRTKRACCTHQRVLPTDQVRVCVQVHAGAEKTTQGMMVSQVVPKVAAAIRSFPVLECDYRSHSRTGKGLTVLESEKGLKVRLLGAEKTVE